MYVVLVKRIRKIYPWGLNKGLSFEVLCRLSSLIIPGEGQRMQWPKCFEYQNKDEDNSLNTLNDKKILKILKKYHKLSWLKF